MLKKILAILALLYAAVSFAAVDVNKATAAELDGVKGIGPAISKNIVDERKKGGDFKNWDDFVARVKGIGDTKAANLSKEGLTVNGAEFKKAAAAKDAKADTKAAATDAKAEKKEAKADVKAEAKAEAKKDAKAEKAEKKEAKKKEKEAKAKAEDAKKDAKAAAAKPAASAASAKK